MLGRHGGDSDSAQAPNTETLPDPIIRSRCQGWPRPRLGQLAGILCLLCYTRSVTATCRLWVNCCLGRGLD